MAVARLRLRHVFGPNGETGESNLKIKRDVVSPLDSHPHQQVLMRLEAEESTLRDQISRLERRRERIQALVRFADAKEICGYDDRLLTMPVDSEPDWTAPSDADDVPASICATARADCQRHTAVVQPIGKHKISHKTPVWAQIMYQCIEVSLRNLEERLRDVGEQADFYGKQNAWRSRNVLQLAVEGDEEFRASMVILHPQENQQDENTDNFRRLTVAATIQCATTSV
jgi:hypothetical protein